MQKAIQKDKDTAELKLNYKDGKWRMAKGMENAMGKGEYPILQVKESHEGQFTFKIDNPDDVTFADVPFGPMAGAANPADFADQFKVAKVNPKKIVVDVLNAKPGDPGADYPGGDYVYELRFNNADALDPIITNGGCCKTLASTTDGLTLLTEPASVGIVLAAAALVVFATARWRRAKS